MVLTATPVKTSPQNQKPARLTKTALIDEVADRLGTSKAEVKRILQAMLDVISENLENDVKVNITGFGSFESRLYKSRKGVNPQTGERITIPATKRPVFTPGAALKRAVKGE
jgi:DNA-binding protein HU-beta